MRHNGLSVAAGPLLLLYIFVETAALICLVYAVGKRSVRAYLYFSLTNQIFASIAIVGMMQYGFQGMGRELIDDRLGLFDQAIGFRWPAYMDWFDRHRAIAAFCNFCYRALYHAGMALVIALCIRGSASQAQRFVAAFLSTGILTSLIAGLYPSLGAYRFYHYDPHHFASIEHADIILKVHRVVEGIRDHSITVLPLPPLGLITFPSFHSTMAILVVYLCYPIRILRLPAIVFAGAMLLACPTEGGHYLADILAGILIAFLGITFAEHALPQRETIP